ncbi:MAG: hypothetical protein PHE78_07630 [Candidatus Gastranaerophilales bacterium]|nr:hypothetical protein [Candidatus Gastranaerophilales bacterium]
MLTKYLLLLVLFAPSFLWCSAFAEAPAHQSTKSLSAIEKKKISTHKKIVVLKRKEKVEIKKLYKSQIKLEQAAKDLDSSATRLTVTKKHLDKIEQDLSVTIDGYAQVKKSASDRLVSIYKGSYLSFLNVVFQSQNVSNIIDTMYFQKRLVERDKDVINQMQLKAKRLAELKNNKEREQVNLVCAINNINRRKRQIAESIDASPFSRVPF